MVNVPWKSSRKFPEKPSLSSLQSIVNFPLENSYFSEESNKCLRFHLEEVITATSATKSRNLKIMF